MPELIEAFDIVGISKSPSAFNLEKLNYFNASYIRALSPEDFAKLAEPLHPLLFPPSWTPVSSPPWCRGASTP